MNVPVLTTERLMKREWRESDFDAYAAFRIDPEACKYVGVLNKGEAWRAMAYWAGHWSLLGFGLWCVTLKSGEPIGYCGPYYPKEWPEAEIGWGIYADHQRQGYATEAARASLNYAYKTLGWKTAVSLNAKDNVPSAALALKLGAVLDGHFAVRDTPCNIYRHLSPSQFLTH